MKNLVFIGRAMHLNPDLCFAKEEEEEEADEVEEGEGDSDGQEPEWREGDGDEDSGGDGDGEKEEEEEEGMEVDDAERANGVSSSGSSSNNNNDNITTAATATPKSQNKNSKADPDPLRWVFNRMSHMVVHKGEARRRAVFSWFLAMVAVHEPAVALTHMKLMLLPLRRAVLDAESGGVEHKARSSTGEGGSSAGPEKELTSAELATEVGRLFVA